MVENVPGNLVTARMIVRMVAVWLLSILSKRQSQTIKSWPQKTQQKKATRETLAYLWSHVFIGVPDQALFTPMHGYFWRQIELIFDLIFDHFCSSTQLKCGPGGLSGGTGALADLGSAWNG